MHHGQLPRKATFGDIVTVLGYGNALYKVENFTEQTINEPNGKVSEVFYDLTDVEDYTNYVIADDEDITVVATADNADEYFAKFTMQIKPPTDYAKPFYFGDMMINIPSDYAEVAKVTKKPKAPTKQAVIDGLLDELITMQTVIDVCGTDDGYAVRIDDVKRKLKEVAE